MKTALKIPLKQNARIKVQEGSIAARGDTLVVYSEGGDEIEINIATILKVKPKDIFKHLKKKPSDNISKNELLAEKKSLMNTTSIRSPIKGKIKLVDLNRGTVLISPIENADKVLASPVECRIRSISRDYLEIEIKADKVNGTDAGGNEATGELVDIVKNYGSIFEISSDIEGKIALIREAAADIIAKLDTLGANGLIAEKIPKNENFPHVTVSPAEYKNLSELKKKDIWLRPAHREILILES